MTDTDTDTMAHRRASIIEVSDPMPKLRAATSQVASALADMAQAVEDGELRSCSDVASGWTTRPLANGLRLLLEATGTGTDATANQLYGALTRYLEDHA